MLLNVHCELERLKVPPTLEYTALLRFEIRYNAYLMMRISGLAHSLEDNAFFYRVVPTGRRATP